MKRAVLGSILTCIFLSFGVGASSASASSLKVYDGTKFRAVPQTLSGWNVRGLDGTKIVDITWRRWNTKRAIGIGTAINQGCQELPCGMADSNDLAVWTEKRIRVTAFKPRRGSYQRLRVFQWTGWNKERRKAQEENYHFNLAFLGPQTDQAWRVFRLDRGLS